MSEAFNFPSTGTAEGDLRETVRIRRTERLLELGECPNGCGPLVQKGHHGYECLKCNYLSFGRTLSAVKE